jgi:hypothetical protein
MRRFEDEYTIRRLTRQDAAALARLSQEMKERAAETSLYSPSEVLDRNERGTLISIVAIDSAQRIVGYYALRRSGAGRIATAGVPISISDYSGGNLIKRMRRLLEREALSNGLLGLCGESFINDVMSPIIDQRFDYHPTGVSISSPPADMEKEHRPRYTANLLYFKYLVPPPRLEVNVSDRHRPIISRIYEALGREIVSLTNRDPFRPGRLDGKYLRAKHQGVIQVREAGYRTANDAAETRNSLCTDSGATAVRLEMPLNQPQAAAVCADLEGRGFAFAGIKSGEGGDLLVMQYLTAPMDVRGARTENELAMKIFEYAVSEIRRVSSKVPLP